MPRRHFVANTRPKIINQFQGKAGTLAIFLSENLHEVMPVTRGERFVMLNWMTCWPEEEHAYDHKDLNKKIREVEAQKRKDEANNEKPSKGAKKKRKKQKPQKQQKQKRRSDL